MKDIWMKRVYFSRFAVVGALVLAIAIAGCVSAPQVSSAQGAAVKWTLNGLQSIGGVTPTVLGSPQATLDNSGKALSFNGVNDGLILPVVPIAGMKAFTIEVLFRPESGGPTEQRFLHTEDEAGNRLTMETRQTANGQWAFDTFLLSGTSRLSLYDAAKLHPADRWYWVALRYDGVTMSDFIDGVKEGEGPVTFPAMKEKGQISLGVRLSQVSWFKGLIRDVRFTPAALPENELQMPR